MCWRCTSRGRCCVVSGAPGEQLLAPVTSTNAGPRQQGPAPALQPPTPPVTCPHTGQGDFVPSWWKNDSCCSDNIRRSQGTTSWLLSLSLSPFFCPFLSFFMSPVPSLPPSLYHSVIILQMLCTSGAQDNVFACLVFCAAFCAAHTSTCPVWPHMRVLSLFLISYFFIVLFIVLVLLLFITIPMSFGCWDEEMSLFARQMKEILTLTLTLTDVGTTSFVLGVVTQNTSVRFKFLFFFDPSVHPNSTFSWLHLDIMSSDFLFWCSNKKKRPLEIGLYNWPTWSIFWWGRAEIPSLVICVRLFTVACPCWLFSSQ